MAEHLGIRRRSAIHLKDVLIKASKGAGTAARKAIPVRRAVGLPDVMNAQHLQNFFENT